MVSKLGSAVLRRRLGWDVEHESLSDLVRGESSHYTVPSVVPMCDRKVLYAMMYVLYAVM